MSMSKKDFIALADVLKRVTRSDDGSSVEWNGLLDDLASFCKQTNSNFMRDRWLAYIAGECGPNGGTVKAHLLRIISTSDAQAECTCGHWHFVQTGSMTVAEIQKEFKQHTLNR